MRPFMKNGDAHNTDAPMLATLGVPGPKLLIAFSEAGYGGGGHLQKSTP